MKCDRFERREEGARIAATAELDRDSQRTDPFAGKDPHPLHHCSAIGRIVAQAPR